MTLTRLLSSLTDAGSVIAEELVSPVSLQLPATSCCRHQLRKHRLSSPKEVSWQADQASHLSEIKEVKKSVLVFVTSCRGTHPMESDLLKSDFLLTFICGSKSDADVNFEMWPQSEQAHDLNRNSVRLLCHFRSPLVHPVYFLHRTITILKDSVNSY